MNSQLQPPNLNKEEIQKFTNLLHQNPIESKLDLPNSDVSLLHHKEGAVSDELDLESVEVTNFNPEKLNKITENTDKIAEEMSNCFDTMKQNVKNIEIERNPLKNRMETIMFEMREPVLMSVIYLLISSPKINVYVQNIPYTFTSTNKITKYGTFTSTNKITKYGLFVKSILFAIFFYISKLFL